MKPSVKQIDIVLALAVVVVFAVISFKTPSLFERFERVIYNTEMRLNLPASIGPSQIAIVNIDDKSLEHLGPWPWPRDLIAEMIRILHNNGASFIGLDMLFTHRETTQGLSELRELSRSLSRQGRETQSWIMERLEEIEDKIDNDRKLLGAVEACGNVIFPVLGDFGNYDTKLAVPADSPIQPSLLPPDRITGGVEKEISVADLKTPYEELAKTSHGLAHINLSPNEVFRGQAHLPFIDYRGNLIPSMSLRLAVDYMDAYPGDLGIDGKGVRLGGQAIPAERGQVFVKFKGARRSFPYYSFVDILQVKKVPAVFDEKVVLIGITAQGMGTSVYTPVDPEMPRVELTANVIESFMTGRYLSRPGALHYVELGLMLLVGLLGAAFLPRFNFFPRTVVTGAGLLALFMISLTIFVSVDYWFKIVYIGLAAVTLYIVFSVKEMVASERSILISSQDAIETNRMLGLSLQSQGLLDLAFEKFRKCPVDDAMKDVLYNLGLDFERKRMINKAISVYDYLVEKGGNYRDLRRRIPKLRKFAGELQLGKHGKKEGQIIVSDDLETKPTIGRYEVLKEIGQGAMGVVYKCMDPKLNRLLAIKTIRFSDEIEESKILEVKERFFKEAELAGKLSHPSVIAIYDVGEDYDLTFMAMELLDGENLDAFTKRENLLPLKQILEIMALTADALDYAHDHGVIHRDVKPGNIMLLKNMNIKVTDFGIAKAVSSSHTKSGVILGTPNYMSPEQINGKTLDGRSDVFSLGAVFFQLLTGSLPFQGQNLTELFYQITQVRHPSARKINPAVIKPCEQLVDKALAKHPENRFQRASVFAKYLRMVAQKLEQHTRKSRP